jgi:hypothetical protein
VSAIYRVPVADVLLLDGTVWEKIRGMRLISVDGPWLAHPNVTICTVEDDEADPSFAGKLVQPVFLGQLDGPEVIIERHVLEG